MFAGNCNNCNNNKRYNNITVVAITIWTTWIIILTLHSSTGSIVAVASDETRVNPTETINKEQKNAIDDGQPVFEHDDLSSFSLTTLKQSHVKNQDDTSRRKLQSSVVFSNDVSTTSEKRSYYIGEPILFTQVGRNGITVINDQWQTMIIPKDGVSTIPFPAMIQLRSYERNNIFNNGTVVQFVCNFHDGDISQLYAFLSKYSYNPDSQVAASTNVTIIEQSMLDTNFVFVTSEYFPTNNSLNVISVSNPFTFKLDYINITLDKPSYLPGETMQLSFQQSFANAPIPSYNYEQYIKIYQVPFSYKDDLLQFNNATQVKYIHSSSQSTTTVPLDRQFITWQQPGKYQIVLFRALRQVVLGVSDVFQVRKPSTTNLKRINVTLDNTTYYPHQYIHFTVNANSGNDTNTVSLLGRTVTFTFVRANATHRDFSISTQIIDSFTLPWTSSSLSMDFTVQNTMVRTGFYKIGITISPVTTTTTTTNDVEQQQGYNYIMYVTKAFRVPRPLIVLSSPKRRSYIQGENINFDFYNPYFNLALVRDYYYYHYISIVNSGYPISGPIVGPIYIDGWDMDNYKVRLSPGRYKFVLIRRSNYAEEYMATLPNSTFTVVQNNATVTTDKKFYKKGDDIIITLSTARNILLVPVPTLTWEITIIQNDNPNPTGYFSWMRNFDTSQQSGTTLTDKTNIFWDDTGVFSLAVILEGVWAISEPFTISK